MLSDYSLYISITVVSSSCKSGLLLALKNSERLSDCLSYFSPASFFLDLLAVSDVDTSADASKNEPVIKLSGRG